MLNFTFFKNNFSVRVIPKHFIMSRSIPTICTNYSYLVRVIPTEGRATEIYFVTTVLGCKGKYDWIIIY